ncbi:MAG: hypothetical protein MK179_08340 [Pirellulaceae bacterium]|nr:hypothetical protein [Pirellulaceae bacterium]
MDSLHLCIALGPLAAYATILGAIQFRRRAHLVSGFRDNLTLGLGVIGFVIAGPMELFYPDTVPAWYGPVVPGDMGHWLGAAVWVLLIALYLLCVLWGSLSTRPRIVIYNMGATQFWSLLTSLTKELDLETEQCGQMLHFPNLGVNASIESFASMRYIQLKSVGHQQNVEGWRQLQLALAERLKAETSPRNPGAIPLFLLAGGSVFLMASSLWHDGQLVQQAVIDMLRF